MKIKGTFGHTSFERVNGHNYKAVVEGPRFAFVQVVSGDHNHYVSWPVTENSIMDTTTRMDLYISLFAQSPELTFHNGNNPVPNYAGPVNVLAE